MKLCRERANELDSEDFFFRRDMDLFFPPFCFVLLRVAVARGECFSCYFLSFLVHRHESFCLFFFSLSSYVSIDLGRGWSGLVEVRE